MGFSIRNFAPLAQFQTGWVFHVNGKQPGILKEAN